METAKHTPGPWTAERAVDDAGFETGKVWIIMKGAPCGYDFDRWEDAVLAAAAPDLLDALEAMDALVENLWKAVPWGQTHDLDIVALNEAPLKAKRAIVKARGAA